MSVVVAVAVVVTGVLVVPRLLNHSQTSGQTPVASPAACGAPMTDVSLNSVSMVSSREGWAVGLQGAIAHYCNGQWVLVTSPSTGASLISVWMVSAEEGWAVGDGGTILHYSGGVWTVAETPTNESLYSVDMISSSEGWAVGDSGAILHYTNGSWIVDSAFLGGGSIYALAILPDGEGWAVEDNGPFQQTFHHLSGGRWSNGFIMSVGDPFYLTPFESVSMGSTTDGWAVGNEEYAQFKGGTWTLDPTEAAGLLNLKSVSMVSANEGWSVGITGVIIHYDGTWNRVVGPTSNNLNSVDMLSSADGWAVGDDGTILHYTNGQWTCATSC